MVTTLFGAGEYFRGWSPAAALEACLALFATIVILRSCLRFALSRLSKPNRTQPNSNVLNAYQDFDLTQLGTSLRYTHQPPSPLSPPYWDTDMDEKMSSPESASDASVQSHHGRLREDDIESLVRKPLGLESSRWGSSSAHGLPYLISRPPPAPPLTPPELSSTVFTLDVRAQGQDSFIHQPNPDYTSASTPSSGSQPSTVVTTSYPRRLSYNKTVPIGIPVSRESSSTSDTDLIFPANSYPPTSPVLPPPPTFPELLNNDPTDEAKIGLQGELVAVLDQDGSGWTRHTRVYGGGVCLACAAAGREHGEGGYYGDTVSPEERR